MCIDVSAVVAETMMMKPAVGFDSSLPLLLLLLLTGVYMGNALHTLLVDNVNAENMDNVDMQPTYITENSK